MINAIMYRAQVVRVDEWGCTDPDWCWDIPVYFRDRQAALDAAIVAAKRKMARFGGDWKVEIDHEHVVIM